MLNADKSKNDDYDDSTELKKGFKFKNRYCIDQELTPGGQARVFVVLDITNSNEKKVLKLVDKNDNDTLNNEIDLLKSLNDRSNYILKYFDDFTFHGIKHCIITEYCHKKDLKNEIDTCRQKNVKIAQKKIEYWNKQIVEGIAFLHDNQIIHRDIKPQNIFVTERNCLKIGDFGFSKQANGMISISRIVGTFNYMSPEIINNEKYDNRIDTWGYGCVLYELIFLEKLFDSQKDFELQKQIIEHDIKIPKTMDEFFDHTLSRCLERQPTKRAYMNEIKQLMDKNLLKKYEEAAAAALMEKKLKKAKISNEAAKKSTRRFVSGCSDQALAVWNVYNGQNLKILQSSGSDSINCLAVMEDNQLITATSASNIELWDIESENCLRKFEINQGLLCMAVIDKLGIVSAHSSTIIVVWDVDTGKYIKVLKGNRAVTRCLLVLDNKTQILSGCDDGSIQIWDIDVEICTDTLSGHSSAVTCLISYETDKIISSSADATIKVWNVHTGKCLNTLTGHTSAVSRISLIDDHKLVSASADKTIKVWDVSTGECLNTLTGHSDAISCLVTMFKCLIISAGADKTIRMWNLKEAKCLKTIVYHSKPVSCLALVD